MNSLEVIGKMNFCTRQKSRFASLGAIGLNGGYVAAVAYFYMLKGAKGIYWVME